MLLPPRGHQDCPCWPRDVHGLHATGDRRWLRTDFVSLSPSFPQMESPGQQGQAAAQCTGIGHPVEVVWDAEHVTQQCHSTPGTFLVLSQALSLQQHTLCMPLPKHLPKHPAPLCKVQVTHLVKKLQIKSYVLVFLCFFFNKKIHLFC